MKVLNMLLQNWHIIIVKILVNYTKINVLHALLEQRQTSCFTDNQICPLHNNNTDKESCVASKFQLFSLLIALKIINKENNGFIMCLNILIHRDRFQVLLEVM